MILAAVLAAGAPDLARPVGAQDVEPVAVAVDAQAPSVALRPDGTPTIAFKNASDGALRLLWCAHIDCAAPEANRITTLDPMPTAGDPSLALDAGGRPTVAYLTVGGELRVVRCAASDCSDEPQPVVVAGAGSAPSVALNAAGRPTIVFGANNSLKLLRCTAVDCSDLPDPVTVVADKGAQDLALDASGRPTIAYYDLADKMLRVVRCSAIDCSDQPAPKTLDGLGGAVVDDPSVALDAAGRPTVAYRNYTTGALKVVWCPEPSCLNAHTIRTVDNDGTLWSPSVAVDSNGLPTIAYADSGADDLRVLRCQTWGCTDLNSIEIEPVDDTDVAPMSASLALDDDAVPAVAYTRADGALMLLPSGIAPEAADTPDPEPGPEPGDDAPKPKPKQEPKSGAGCAQANGEPRYAVVTTAGEVSVFGGEMLGEPAASMPYGVSAVDIEFSASGDGYWVVDELGGVYAYGDAQVWGSFTGLVEPGEKIVAISRFRSSGLWAFSDRGGVFSLADAPDYGNVAHLTLNGAIRDSVALADGSGYAMVAADGGSFHFGESEFHGSLPGIGVVPNHDVVGMIPDRCGRGYYLFARDGGIFTFSNTGDLPFLGALPAFVDFSSLNGPVVAAVNYGEAYLLAADDGGVFNFSKRLAFQGSFGAQGSASAVVSIAAAP